MVQTRNSGAHEIAEDDVKHERGSGEGPKKEASSPTASSAAKAEAPSNEERVSTRNSTRRVAFKYETDEWELGASPTRPRRNDADNDSLDHTPVAAKTRGQSKQVRKATPYLQRNGNLTNGSISEDEEPFMKRGSRSSNRPSQSRERTTRGRGYGAYEEVDPEIFSEDDSRDSLCNNNDVNIRSSRRQLERNRREDQERQLEGRSLRSRPEKPRPSLDEESEGEDDAEEELPPRRNKSRKEEGSKEGGQPKTAGGRRTRQSLLSSPEAMSYDDTSTANNSLDSLPDESGDAGVTTRRSLRRVSHSDDEVDDEEEQVSTRRSTRRREASDDEASSRRRSLRRNGSAGDGDEIQRNRQKLFGSVSFRSTRRSLRSARSFVDDEAIEDNTWLSEEDNDAKDDNDEDREEEDNGLDMYTRVKERHKARQAALRAKGDGEESESGSEDESEEEEEEEEGVAEGQQRERTLRKKIGRQEGKSEEEKRSYSFRTRRAPPQFYQEPLHETRPRARRDDYHVTDTPPKRPPKPTHVSPAYRKTIRRRSRTRKAIHRSSSTSSSSSSDPESSDEKKFQRRKAKSMQSARRHLRPMNFEESDIAATAVRRDRTRIGTSLADVDPMAIDKNVLFDSVGGLSRHIRSLKEMVVFPLLYPEIFEHFKIEPPRGCIFYGPPGTGKTLMARALANECTKENAKKRVAFFMRKGADCLSKWVGESERQLRLLFDQAYQMRPSIIFFDEIDGLAPVRSSRQDQIHSSIVSTLLALMDGLDARGQVIVIGATNRLDSLDPALRRPGRFDREFLFPLPDAASRKSILEIHTRHWNPPPSRAFIDGLAQSCHGYCGADLKALCTEATLCALRRRYPQIYASSKKLSLDVESIRLEGGDFSLARKKIVPAAHRSSTQYGVEMPKILLPFLENVLKEASQKIEHSFVAIMSNKQTPGGSGALVHSDDSDGEENDLFSNPINDSSAFTASKASTASNSLLPPLSASRRLSFSDSANIGEISSGIFGGMSGSWHRPSFRRSRLLLQGSRGSGIGRLAPAVLHCFEKYPIHALNLHAICSSPAPPEEIITIVKREAKRNAPSILYVPAVTRLWSSLGTVGQAALFDALDDASCEGDSSNSPVLVLATSEEEPPEDLSSLFDPLHGETLLMPETTTAEARRRFFSPLILVLPSLEKPYRRRRLSPEEAMVREPLPVASEEPEPTAMTEEELKRLRENEKQTLTELRIFLREMLGRLLRDRRFSIFSRPIDPDIVPDYFEIIKKPMDLSTMMAKIDRHEYSTARSFLDDIELVCDNALEYNPDETNEDRAIRHRACTLKDVSHAIITAEYDPEFEKRLEEIVKSRTCRGETPSKSAPAFSRVLPAHMRHRRPLLPRTESEGDVGVAPMEDHRIEEGNGDSAQTREAYRERPKKRKRRSQWARGVVRVKKRRIESEDDDEEDDGEKDEGDNDKGNKEEENGGDDENGGENMEADEGDEKVLNDDKAADLSATKSSNQKGGRRRVKCGVCGPCLIKENCRKCRCCKYYYKWRKTCEQRVCVDFREKRKKVDAPPTSSPRLDSADTSSRTPTIGSPLLNSSLDSTVNECEDNEARFSPFEESDNVANSKHGRDLAVDDSKKSENCDTSSKSNATKSEEKVHSADTDSSADTSAAAVIAPPSDAVPAADAQPPNPHFVVDENSSASGVTSSGIDSELSSSPKVVSFDEDEESKSQSRDAASAETASSPAQSGQGPSKTPVGSAFNQLIETALAHREQLDSKSPRAGEEVKSMELDEEIPVDPAAPIPTSSTDLTTSPKKSPASPVRTRRQLAALEAMEIAPSVALPREETPPPSPVKRVDSKRLESLLDHVVDSTKDFSLHSLEKLHAALSQVTWRRRFDTERENMVEEMEAVVNSVVNSS